MDTRFGKFQSVQESRRAYAAVNGLVRKLGLDAFVSRWRSGSEFYVCFVSEGEIGQISSEVTQKIFRLLSQGQIDQLPPEVLAAIERRRRQRLAQQEDLRKQMLFREDPAAYLADLEERWSRSASLPAS